MRALFLLLIVAMSTQVSVPGPDAQQIEVTLDEFSISPSPLRIPVGQSSHHGENHR